MSSDPTSTPLYYSQCLLSAHPFFLVQSRSWHVWQIAVSLLAPPNTVFHLASCLFPHAVLLGTHTLQPVPVSAGARSHFCVVSAPRLAFHLHYLAFCFLLLWLTDGGTEGDKKRSFLLCLCARLPLMRYHVQRKRC